MADEASNDKRTIEPTHQPIFPTNGGVDIPTLKHFIQGVDKRSSKRDGELDAFELSHAASDVLKATTGNILPDGGRKNIEAYFTSAGFNKEPISIYAIGDFLTELDQKGNQDGQLSIHELGMTQSHLDVAQRIVGINENDELSPFIRESFGSGKVFKIEDIKDYLKEIDAYRDGNGKMNASEATEAVNGLAESAFGKEMPVELKIAILRGENQKLQGEEIDFVDLEKHLQQADKNGDQYLSFEELGYSAQDVQATINKVDSVEKSR